MAALSIARAYQYSFETRPNVTLALTGGTLNALGDFVAQVTQNVTRPEDKPYRRFDYARTARFFFFGLTISPIMGRWNALLETRFPLRVFRHSKKISFAALSKRVACDQLFMAPLGLAYFLGLMGVTEGRSSSQISEKFKGLYQPAIIANWKVWPLAQLINFRYMPLAYRVPFSQGCGVVWTLYLSVLNSRAGEIQDTKVALQHKAPLS